ncbi:hypothetical protein [uncultured Tenacibaculum sp.]|uniref:hypothetical protein n=1 Tax=uncultured Tenacibaculum sp. TaxID=174713 RepID=UPI0026378DD6|nr:hypothetical protein [uncultured Tenacibaculum sp.]
MNAIKLLLLAISFTCYSQTKNDDAFFLLKKTDKNYLITPKNEIFKKGDLIHLVDRNKYETFLKKREELKKNKSYYYDPESGQDNIKFNVPSLSFAIQNKELINHCETHFLNFVNYKWIKENTWKENNPNIIFKDLYFLLKIEKDKYLKLKVVRVVIAH